ncbi:olfactory receptor 6F1-like [Lithobates pipiens]
MNNKTKINEFLLLGFQNLHHYRIFILLLLILIYTSTIVGNLMILILVSTRHSLRNPMNFFLGQLSLCDILISTNVAPNMIHILVHNGSRVFVRSCAVQLFFFGASALIECCLLTMMSYDRYLAICKPLHYLTIMTIRFTYSLAVWCWVIGFSLSFIIHISILELHFCDRYTIDHFFCDLAPLLDLSCIDTTKVRIEVSVVTTLLGLVQFFLIIVSYSYILKSIFRIPSSFGRQKAFSTCSSHLSVVLVYYGSLIILYVSPKANYLNLNKMLSFFNTVVTPLFNPIVYSLRSQEIRKALSKLFVLGKEHIMRLI